MSGRGRGRGQYYKEKYGGGRGRKRTQEAQDTWGSEADNQTAAKPAGGGSEAAYDQSYDAEMDTGRTAQGVPMGNLEDLRRQLKRCHGRNYGDTRGVWSFFNGEASIWVEHVQKDAYAAPSRCSVQVSHALARFPSDLWASKTRRIALCDFLSRRFAAEIHNLGADSSSGSQSFHAMKGGNLYIEIGRQHVIERNNVLLSHQGDVEARFTFGFPGKARTALGDPAAAILTEVLPRLIRSSLFYQEQPLRDLVRHIECVEDTEMLRAALPSHGLVGFVANGSILPSFSPGFQDWVCRLSGASDKPLTANVQTFVSPKSMEVEIQLPRGAVRGMGIWKGITLIVGGGFHGKSTLLKALEAGYTNKIPGDGRELVVTLPDAYKIRAEDGRRVEGVNITTFISNLPFGKETDFFCTDDASGSTSQAANIMEALECGSRVLLIDEDTTATNFMIRDERMQALVAPDKEPITPLVSKVRALAEAGVSLVLVIGGSGSYFEVADRVVAMEAFAPRDVTARAHEIASQTRGMAGFRFQHTPFGAIQPRTPTHVITGTDWELRAKTSLHEIVIGKAHLDLHGVEQIFEESQTRAIAGLLKQLRRQIKDGPKAGQPLADVLDALAADLDDGGLDVAGGPRVGNLARPRMLELAAAFNRLRTAIVRRPGKQVNGSA